MITKTFKKFILITLSITTVLTYISPSTSYANVEKPNISSEAAILMDANTGEILYKKNENKKLYPASITKIMTALVVLENANLSGELSFSKRAVTDLDTGAVTIGAKEGDKLLVVPALYALMLKSANDVGNALAEYTSGSIEDFARLMTRRAKELGAKNTNFVNPHGLTHANHYTTAYDMALITREAFKNAKFAEIVKTTYYTVSGLSSKPSISVSMGHKMLHTGNIRYYQGMLGGKTGYTKAAGNTLVTVVERNNKRLIAVVLKSNGTHYDDTKALLDYGFSKYGLITKNETGKVEKNTNIALQTSNTTNANNEGPKASNTNEQNTDYANSGPGVNSSKIETSSAIETINTVSSTESLEVVESISSVSPIESTSVVSGPNASIKQEDIETWKQDEKGWRYIKANSTYAKNEKLNIKGHTYWFGNDTYMLTSWQKDNAGDWYYMRNSGEMKKSSWLLYNDKWYYLSADGKMLKDTFTPDGYKLDAAGAWVQ